MKSKKAQQFFSEHVLNIIIAVFCLIVLVGAGVIVYKLVSGDQQDAKAQSELNEIMDVVNRAYAGDGAIEHIVLGLDGWAIVGWPLDNYNVKYCADNGWINCLCICDLRALGSDRALKGLSKKTTQKACEDKPICAEIKAKDFYVNPLDVWLLSFLDSRHRPIILGSFMETSVEKISINYDKTTDKLEILPVRA